MKTKKFSKKLVLNKKTIADLNKGNMRRAYGGAPTQVPEQPSPTPLSIKPCAPPPDPTSCVCTDPYTDCTC